MKNQILKSLLTSTSIVAFAWASTTGACQSHADVDTVNTYSSFLAKANAVAGGKQVEYVIPSISCMSCAYKIKKAIKPMAGIGEINVDPDTHKLRFKCDNCDQEAVKSTLEEIGYPVAKTT